MCHWAGGMGWRLFALTMPPQAFISLSLRPTILILLSSAHQTQSRCSLVLPDSWPHQHPCSDLFFILTVPVIHADAFWFPGIPVSRTGLLQCLSILELSSATDSVIVSQAYYQQPQPSWDFSDIHCSLMTSSSLSWPGLIDPTVPYCLPLLSYLLLTLNSSLSSWASFPKHARMYTSFMKPNSLCTSICHNQTNMSR